jgi:hypothetical protein
MLELRTLFPEGELCNRSITQVSQLLDTLFYKLHTRVEGEDSQGGSDKVTNMSRLFKLWEQYLTVLDPKSGGHTHG